MAAVQARAEEEGHMPRIAGAVRRPEMSERFTIGHLLADRRDVTREDGAKLDAVM
jgi:hypothetical protein